MYKTFQFRKLDVLPIPRKFSERWLFSRIVPTWNINGHFWIYQCTLYTFFLSKKQHCKNLNSLTSQRGVFWGLSLCTPSWAFKNSFFQLFRFVFFFVPQFGYTKLFLKGWIHFLLSHWWATLLSLLILGMTKSQRPSFKK